MPEVLNPIKSDHPFGMVMPGRNWTAASAEGYGFGYQGSSKDNNISNEFDNYTTFYRLLDVRLGRWKSVDPKSDKSPWESPYCSMAGNPINYNDPNGDIIVDKKGKEVKVKKDKNNNITGYEFDASYSTKQNEKMEKWFDKHSAVVLNAMDKSNKEDLDFMIDSKTKFKIKALSRFNKNAASHVKGDILEENPEKIWITPYLGGQKKYTDLYSTTDFNEYMGMVMAVEVGHIRNVKKEMEFGSLYNNDPDMLSVYTDLFIRATEVRIQYRTKMGKPITDEILDFLNIYNVPEEQWSELIKETKSKYNLK